MNAAGVVRVGQVLKGFCGGYFGRDSYSDKLVEAVGADWVVAREGDTGTVVFAACVPEDLLPHVKQEVERSERVRRAAAILDGADDSGELDDFDPQEGCPNCGRVLGQSCSDQASGVYDLWACDNCGFTHPIRMLSPAEWMDVTGIRVVDPDGWRTLDAPTWETPISEAEFRDRASRSTTDYSKQKETP